MKKIVGSFIVLAALWAGTTAYIGAQMEGTLQEHFKKINKLYAQKGIHYKLSNYKKSFFNSKATVEVEITEPNMKALLEERLKLPLVMNYEIEHGPIFFQNGFGFGAAKTHQEIMVSSLLNDQAKKDFLSLVKNDMTITSDVIISLTKNAHYRAISDGIDINQDKKAFNMSPLTIEGEMNLDNFSGESNINIDSITFKEAGTQNGLTIDKLKIAVDIEKFIEEALMIETIKLSMNNLSIQDESNPKLKHINMAPSIYMYTQQTSKDRLSTMFEGTIDLKDTKLPSELPPLKKIHASMNMNEVGIKGLMEFQKATQDMQQAQSELITKMQSNSKNEEMQKIFEEFETLQVNMMNQIVHALNTLLVKDKTTIGYQFNIETKDKKESHASVEIKYTGDMKFDGSLEEIAMKAQQEVLNMADIDIKLMLDSEHLKNLPNAETLQQQIQMGVVQGFVKEENGKYILNGYYKNRELMVNDNNLTATVLPFLMMATQGGGF